MKKISFLIIFAITCLFPAIPASAEPAGTESAAPPELSAEAAVLMDAATGDVLYEKNSRQEEYPASITKLMTVLLALEKGSLTDSVTISHEAVANVEPGSASIALQEGETLTLEQILRAILLRSANEAANAAAEYTDGSIEAFAAHMNSRAAELGCENTHFVNPSGLHEEAHTTTAYDMALISRALLQNETFRSIMGGTYYEIPPTNKQTETRYLHGQHQMLNSNSLYYYEYATGGKTGFTEEARNTLVTFAEKDRRELIAVVLKCEGAEHYTDTKALFEYGFDNFETRKILSAADYIQTVSVTEVYRDDPVTLGSVSAAASDIEKTMPKNTDLSALKVTVECPETVEGPVARGQALGSLTVSQNGEVLATAELLAQADVPLLTEEQKAELDKSSRLGIAKKILKILGGIVLGFCALLCVTRAIGYYRWKKRRARRRRRRR